MSGAVGTTAEDTTFERFFAVVYVRDMLCRKIAPGVPDCDNATMGKFENARMRKYRNAILRKCGNVKVRECHNAKM